MTTTRTLIGSTLLASLLLGVGFAIGRSGREQVKEQAREAEYIRVVGAIARTMRCSDEFEYAKGQDHECDPSEIEQDAGLVDADGSEGHQPTGRRN